MKHIFYWPFLSRAHLIWECIQGTSFFVTNANSNDWIFPQWYNTDKKIRQYIDTLLIKTPSLNDFHAHYVFEKTFVTKDQVFLNHS